MQSGGDVAIGDHHAPAGGDVDAIVIGDGQVGVDVQPRQRHVFAFGAGQRPAGGVDQPDAAHGNVAAPVEEQALAGAAADLLRALQHLLRGEGHAGRRDLAYSGVIEGIAGEVDGAAAVDGHIVVPQIDDEGRQVAHLVVMIGLHGIIRQVGRGLQDCAAFQMQGHALEVNGAAEECTGGDQHRFAGLGCCVDGMLDGGGVHRNAVAHRAEGKDILHGCFLLKCCLRCPQ